MSDRVSGILVEGPLAGRRFWPESCTRGILNFAPPPEIPRPRLPEPSRWRFRRHRRWEDHPRGRFYLPAEPLPMLVYRYAGMLDDGTLVFRFDAQATWPAGKPFGISERGPGSWPVPT